MKMIEVWAPVKPDIVYYEDGKEVQMWDQSLQPIFDYFLLDQTSNACIQANHFGY